MTKKFHVCRFSNKSQKWEVIRSFSDETRAIEWMNAQPFECLRVKRSK